MVRVSGVVPGFKVMIDATEFARAMAAHNCLMAVLRAASSHDVEHRRSTADRKNTAYEVSRNCDYCDLEFDPTDVSFEDQMKYAYRAIMLGNLIDWTLEADTWIRDYGPGGRKNEATYTDKARRILARIKDYYQNKIQATEDTEAREGEEWGVVPDWRPELNATQKSWNERVSDTAYILDIQNSDPEFYGFVQEWLSPSKNGILESDVINTTFLPPDMRRYKRRNPIARRNPDLFRSRNSERTTPQLLRNPDESLRQIERQAQMGDPEAIQQLRRMQLRVEMRREDIQDIREALLGWSQAVENLENYCQEMVLEIQKNYFKVPTPFHPSEPQSATVHAMRDEFASPSRGIKQAMANFAKYGSAYPVRDRLLWICKSREATVDNIAWQLEDQKIDYAPGEIGGRGVVLNRWNKIMDRFLACIQTLKSRQSGDAESIEKWHGDPNKIISEISLPPLPKQEN